MSVRSWNGLLGIAIVLMTTIGAQAADSAIYPDLRGAWSRFVVRGLGGQPSFDQTKPWGRGQQAPLTPEYQKIFEEVQADLKAGGPGNWPSTFCIPAGMPAMMSFYDPAEIIVTPETTYIPVSYTHLTLPTIYSV